LPDSRVCVDGFDPRLLRQLLEQGAGLAERVLALGEDVHELRRALEELDQLLDAQLPR
jgi:hypothetical protein